MAKWEWIIMELIAIAWGLHQIWSVNRLQSARRKEREGKDSPQ